MMSTAVTNPHGDLQPGSVEQVLYLKSQELNQQSQPQISQPRIERFAEVMRTQLQQDPVGFKDLVQKKCEDRGILFMPLLNRFKNSKQVYKIGNVQCYIDNDLLFVCHSGTNWVPTSLNTLLDTAEIS